MILCRSLILSNRDIVTDTAHGCDIYIMGNITFLVFLLLSFVLPSPRWLQECSWLLWRLRAAAGFVSAPLTSRTQNSLLKIPLFASSLMLGPRC